MKTIFMQSDSIHRVLVITFRKTLSIFTMVSRDRIMADITTAEHIGLMVFCVVVITKTTRLFEIT